MKGRKIIKEEIKRLDLIKVRFTMILFQRIVIIIITAFVITTINAQTTFKNIIDPSPTSVAFDKYGNIPISYYTGVPNITIPIYEIKNRDLKVPITLSYHGSGIKVSEEATRVGLGWVLNCGGVINRNVNGNDDFKPQYGYVNNSIPEVFDEGLTSRFLSGSDNVSDNTSNGPTCTKKINGQWVDLSNYLPEENWPVSSQYDFEPDIFSYNFLGYNGKFVIKKNKEIVKESPDPLTIKLVDPTGASWQIITPEGLTFLFNKTETCLFQEISGPSNSYITSWYLTKITSPSGAEIIFNYSIGNSSNNATTTYNELQERSILSSKHIIPGGAECVTFGYSRSYSPIKTYTPIYLESITYPFGNLSFIYMDRDDLYGEKRLTEIDVNNADPTFNLKFKFLQDYFTANIGGSFSSPVPHDINYYTKRLKLVSFTKEDSYGNQNGKHQFIYNEINLPPKNSFSRDHWGYYNFSNATTFLPKINYISAYDPAQILTYDGANRNANPDVSQAFMLKEISYPTGGKSVFEFEQNEYDVGNSINQMQQSTQSDIRSITQNFLTQRGLSETFTLSIPSTFTGVPVEVFLHSYGGGQPTPVTYPNDAYLQIFTSGSTSPIHTLSLGTQNDWVNNGTNNDYTVNDKVILPPGIYTIKTVFPDKVSFLRYIEIRFKWYYDYNEETNTAKHPIEFAGGLRIRRITDIDPVAGKSNIRRFKYDFNFDYNHDNVAERCSYGRRLADVHYIRNELVPTCIPQITVSGVCETSTISSSSYIATASPIVGYDKVTVLNGEDGENGMSEYTYQNQPERELPYKSSIYQVENLQPPGIPNVVNLSNGLLVRATDYRYNKLSSSFEKVREISNVYISSPEITELGIKKLVQVKSMACATSKCGWILVEYPAFQSKCTRIESNTLKEFESNSQNYIVSKTNYKYEIGSPVHYQPIETIKETSDKNKIHTYQTYASDYPVGTSFIDAMRSSYITGLPIETVTAKEDLSGNITILRGNVLQYKQTVPNLLEAVYTLETASSIALNNFKFSNRLIGILPNTGIKTPFTKDLNYKPYITFLYNSSNNLIEQSKAGDLVSSYIWGYNKNYPVAEITGATYSSASSFITQAILDNPQSTDQNIRDELEKIRLGLSNSKVLVNTFTYKPLIGMTSKTTANSQTTYYEYDPFGRLKRAKDMNGKILKAYDYKISQ